MSTILCHFSFSLQPTNFNSLYEVGYQLLHCEFLSDSLISVVEIKTFFSSLSSFIASVSSSGSEDLKKAALACLWTGWVTCAYTIYAQRYAKIKYYRTCFVTNFKGPRKITCSHSRSILFAIIASVREELSPQKQI